MNKPETIPVSREPNRNSSGIFSCLRRLTAISFAALVLCQILLAQQPSFVLESPAPGPFRIGERLTYNVSLGQFENAGFAETYVASRGKLDGRDAVELRMRIKTNDFVSAAFFFVDMSRTTFAAIDTGLPLFISRTSNESGLPKTAFKNYLDTPTVNYDLLTLIFRVRQLGGTGSFSLFEEDNTFNASVQSTVSEQVSTAAGDFDTVVSTVASDYLTQRGISKMRVNLSQDEARIPVLVRFETNRGEIRAELSSARIVDGGIAAAPTPVPTPTPAATPTPTPKPPPTPEPYRENQPLSSDLPFRLGETLEYAVTNGGQPFATVVFQAKQRTQFRGEDSLVLAANVTGVDGGNAVLKLNDGIIARVNPDSLAPRGIELKFSGSLAKYNQTVEFDQRSGTAAFSGSIYPDIPVGTHSLLSLAYAVRSFNLRPSKDLSNPVNDTRVAVFIDDGAYILILRPKNPEFLTLQGKRIAAQEISITTGISSVDVLNLRVWLSIDEERTPLRLIAGPYQADLVSEKIVTPPKPEALP